MPGMLNESLWEKFESECLNEGLTAIRIRRLKSYYVLLERGIGKRLNEATRDDIESFMDDLNRNRFTQANGNPYKGSSKAGLKIFVKKFYKWQRGNNEIFPPEVRWIKTRIPKDEKPIEKTILSYDEVVKLANACNNPRLRILTLMLFDSGFRIEEMMSARKRDLTWGEFIEAQPGIDAQSCFWIRCTKSKTEQRNIPIPLFTEDIETFCNSAYYRGLADDDRMFNFSSDNARMTMGRRAKEVLGKKISPHCLRHSSATYYAKEYDGNMNLLAERYGWTYSSRQLQLYIRRSGAYQKAAAKKSFENQVVKQNEKMRALESEMSTIKRQMDELMQIRKDKESLKRALAKKGH